MYFTVHWSGRANWLAKSPCQNFEVFFLRFSVLREGSSGLLDSAGLATSILGTEREKRGGGFNVWYINLHILQVSEWISPSSVAPEVPQCRDPRGFPSPESIALQSQRKGIQLPTRVVEGQLPAGWIGKVIWASDGFLKKL